MDSVPVAISVPEFFWSIFARAPDHTQPFLEGYVTLHQIFPAGYHASPRKVAATPPEAAIESFESEQWGFMKADTRTPDEPPPIPEGAAEPKWFSTSRKAQMDQRSHQQNMKPIKWTKGPRAKRQKVKNKSPTSNFLNLPDDILPYHICSPPTPPTPNTHEEK